MPSANLGHRGSRRRDPSASTGASTITTLPPETTSRCDRPLARKSRSSAGSSIESSPSDRPSKSPAALGEKSSRIERPTRARNDCAHRTKATSDGPIRTPSRTRSSAAIPRRRRNRAKPGSCGTRSCPVSRSRSPRTASGASSRPSSQTDSRTEAERFPHRTVLTSAVADHPSRSSRGSIRRTAWTVTVAGARRASSASSTLCAWAPPQPSPRQTTPTITSTAAAPGGPRPGIRRGGASTSTGRGTRPSPTRASMSTGSRTERGAVAAAATSPIPPIASHTGTGRRSPTAGRARSPAHIAAAADGRSHSLRSSPAPGCLRAWHRRSRSRPRAARPR